MTKRPDIQGIRGLAIAAVLAFHLNEDAFPAGFVGVDMFFVLSGYLMSLILSKESELNLDVFRNFYIRRFKRIVPLYAITIAALTVLVPCLLMQRDVLKFCQDVVWAAAFATNIHTVLEKKDYYAELFDSNVLIHTWSLGVEIQYYLIVPFIILAQRQLALACGRFPFILLLLLGSLAFQMLSSPNTAFNMLPSRVWQFLAGGLAYELSSGKSLNHVQTGSSVKYQKLETEKLTETEVDRDLRVESGVIDFHDDQPKQFARALESLSTDFLSCVLTALVLCPWLIFPVPLLRFVAVSITSGLLVLGNDENRQGVVLTNRPIVYLGDISYVVYLAHWPVIVIWKSVADTNSLHFYGIASCLAITATISIIAHHTLEQFFIRAKAQTTTILVAVLYGFLAIALVFNVPERINLKKSAAPTDLAEAIKWNDHVWDGRTKHYYDGKGPFKECVEDPEGTVMRGGGVAGEKIYAGLCVWNRKNVTGSLKILVIGNSFAHRASKILGPIIAKKFPQVATYRQYSHASCAPIETTDGCGDFLAHVPTLVRAMKPDITFYIYNDSKRLRAPLPKKGANDTAMREFNDFFQIIANSSRFVILDEFYPFPSTPAGVAASLSKRLTRKQSTTDLKGSYAKFKKDYANYFARLDQVRIPNLIRHNTSAVLCGEEKGWCWWYNRKNLRSYYQDNSHLSLEGLELMRESYTKILKKIIDKLKV